MSELDLAVSIALGIGLAAATGLRVFLPLLIVSAAAYAGLSAARRELRVARDAGALTLLGVAAIVEILAYYIPGVDNLLDTIATPAAFVAGTMVSAAVITDMPPLVKWATAVIAGGGIAGADARDDRAAAGEIHGDDRHARQSGAGDGGGRRLAAACRCLALLSPHRRAFAGGRAALARRSACCGKLTPHERSQRRLRERLTQT